MSLVPLLHHSQLLQDEHLLWITKYRIALFILHRIHIKFFFKLILREVNTNTSVDLSSTTFAYIMI